MEVEKALVDPLFMPIIRPVLAWAGRHTPACLSFDMPPFKNPLRGCTRPKAGRTASVQRRVLSSRDAGLVTPELQLHETTPFSSPSNLAGAATPPAAAAEEAV